MHDYQSIGLASVRDRIAARGWTGTREIVIGTLFLALCGWKFTAGLSRVLDLDVSWHEARYLAWVTHHTPGPVPADYSPLYVAFYHLEQLFTNDAVRLYYMHTAVVAILLPIALFIYLTVRSVPFILALLSAAYLMISAADLPVAPKPVHLALVIIFAAMAAFVALGERSWRWALILAIAGCLSLVRPEFLISLAVLAVYVGYRAVIDERARWRILAAFPLAAAATVPVFWSLGLPLFNDRSMDAFSRHFALNYVAWHRTGQDPLAVDHLAIFHAVFDDAKSIPAAFLANPGAFLHHVAVNLYHAPKALIELFLAHYNLLLPRFQLYTVMEAVALGIAVVAVIAVLWLKSPPSGSAVRPRNSARLAGLRQSCRHLLRDLPDSVCLLCFLIPFPIMVAVLYPRYHYVLGLGLIPVTMFLTAVGPRLPLPKMTPRRLLLLPLLFALIPSLGSAGASFTFTKIEVESRPNLNIVDFFRQIHPRRPVTILEAAWVEPYLDAAFSGVSQEEKSGPFLSFLAQHNINAVIANDRLRNDERYRSDPEWREFEGAPERFGFHPYPIEESDIVVYLKDGVLANPP